MKSTTTVILMFFYVGLLGQALVDQEWNKVMYWTGAIMATGAVFMMR